MDIELTSNADDADQGNSCMSEKIATIALDGDLINEQTRIFRNAWVPVCHESELSEPYDFRTALAMKISSFAGRQMEKSMRY